MKRTISHDWDSTGTLQTYWLQVQIVDIFYALLRIYACNRRAERMRYLKVWQIQTWQKNDNKHAGRHMVLQWLICPLTVMRFDSANGLLSTKQFHRIRTVKGRESGGSSFRFMADSCREHQKSSDGEYYYRPRKTHQRSNFGLVGGLL